MELKLDQWATTPPVGYPGAVPPPPGKRSAGFTNGEEPPAGYFNHAWDALADTQNELANLITGAGLTRSESDLSQVLAAIKRMSVARIELAALTQWVDLELGSGGFAIAASPMQLVVVGQSAGIRQHTGSQIAWNARTAAAGYAGDFWDVCWSSTFNRFVAVGSAREIQDSPTGQTWTRRSTGAGDLSGCAAGSAAVVAVGGVLLMSTVDGTNWISRTSAHAGAVMSAVAYSPSLNRFCAVGATDAGVMFGEIQYSNDGVTWSLATLPAGCFGLTGVIWSAVHGLFFAWSQGDVIKSADGVTWVAASGPVTFSNGAGILSVVALPAHLCAFNPGPPQHVNLYRVDELDGTPATVVDLSLLYSGAVGTANFNRVIRVPPDSGNAFAGRLLAVGYTRISASHYLG